MDFNSTRQLHSAIIARGMYYQNLDSAPAWQREIALRNWNAEPMVEPQIFERLVAMTYRLAGGEYVWIARVYSILFWLAGAIGLFLLARRLVGVDGALVGLAYFLVLPFAAIASRSFQPDPLMTALIVFALWAIVRWERQPAWKWVIAAGLLGGLAILIKAVAVFFIAGAFAGILLSGQRFKQLLRNRQVWVIGFLSVLPYAIYHVYGVYITGLLQSQFSLRFFPKLWIDPVFYLRWKSMISSTVRFEWLIVAFLATFLIKRPSHRGMLVGLWVGYLLFGLTLPYHISTHDYYQLPLVAVVALGLASAAGQLAERAQGPRLLLVPAVLGLLLFTLAVEAWDVRVTLKRLDYRQEHVFWEQLGKKLGENVAVVGLTQDYGFRLAYYGWVASENWPSSNDFNLQELAGNDADAVRLFKERTAGKDYFVITMLPELERQPMLGSLLYQHYAVVEETSDYVIFDLHHPLPAAP